MHYTKSCGGFSLAPSGGERTGERGCSVLSIPRSQKESTHSLGHYWQLCWSYSQLPLVRIGGTATAHVTAQTPIGGL